MISQIRRCSISIPSNIAEGSQRGLNREFANFILISKSSLAELETQALLSSDLDFINKNEIDSILEKINELNKMLFSFHKKLTTNH